MSEALGTLHAHVCKVLAVHGQQVAVEQALLGGLIVTVFTVVEFGLLISQDKLVRS